jgi:hypothetical protein
VPETPPQVTQPAVTPQRQDNPATAITHGMCEARPNAKNMLQRHDACSASCVHKHQYSHSGAHQLPPSLGVPVVSCPTTPRAIWPCAFLARPPCDALFSMLRDTLGGPLNPKDLATPLPETHASGCTDNQVPRSRISRAPSGTHSRHQSMTMRF